MQRTEIIQQLIHKNRYEKYLEIGVEQGDNFLKIDIPNKIGVDPDSESAATFWLTSDEFFERNRLTFDVIFVDGLHFADQTHRDIINSLAVLDEGGTILVHDNLPINKRMQEVPRGDRDEWTGDVWRAWLRLRSERSDLEMSVINSDWGVGIIRIGKQECVKLPKPVEEITYEEWNENKVLWANVVSVEEFKQKYL